MKSIEISEIIIKDLIRRQFPVFITQYSGHGIYEADVFGINRNGFMFEYEIKRSRSDFYADFINKEGKHRRLKQRDYVSYYDEWKNGKKTGNKTESILIPNRFYFACEPELLTIKDIPEYAGLVYINHELIEIKNAPLLHRMKANETIYAKAASIFSYRMVYGCSYLTHKNNERKLKYDEINGQNT